MAFATDGKTFCHQWQNVFSPVRKIDPLYRVRGTSLSSAPLWLEKTRGLASEE